MNDAEASKIDSKHNSHFMCPNCNSGFNDNVNHPYSLPACKHPLCKKCFSELLSSGQKIYKCKICSLQSELTSNNLEDYVFVDEDYEEDEDYTGDSQGSREDQSLIEDLCERHKDKLIEYFCEECVRVVCVTCMFQNHNGHKLTNLHEKCNVIKHNIKDFKKVVTNLHQANQDNKKVVEQRFEEIENLKEAQKNIVEKVFNDIAQALVDKKSQFNTEFDSKYLYEEKRFRKLYTLMSNIDNEVETILKINDELTNFAETKGEATILKRINDFTTFLQKSYLDLRRLYKTEMSLKAELKMDPATIPISINIRNLILIIEKIDPKLICYSTESAYQNDYNHGIDTYKHKPNNIYSMRPHSKSNLDESSNITGNNPNQKIQYDYLAEDLKNFKTTLAMMDNSGIKTDSESDIFKRKNKLNIPKPQKQGGNANKLPSMMQNRFNREMNQVSNNLNNSYVNTKRSSNNSRNNLKSQSPSKFSLPRLNSIDKINHLNEGIVNTGGGNNREFYPALIVFSDSSFVLKFNLDSHQWYLERLDNISTFDGGLKYCGLTCIKKNRLIISGGCSVETHDPTSNLYEINSMSANHSIKLKPMSHKRWAHSAVFIHPFLYFLGGFDHKDISKAMHSTLKYCERYHIETNRYEGIAQLNQARAFMGTAVVNNENIFVFGGFYNDTLIPSIEKYDTLANVWITYHVKLFDSMAKMGVVNYKNNIVLLGGINEEFQVTNKVVVLDLQTGKWKKLPEMSAAREFNNSAFIYNSCIYAIGGNFESTCERFDFLSNKWKPLESYTKLLKSKNRQNEMYTYCFSLNFIED